MEATRHREVVEMTNSRLRNEEIQKSVTEERFEKAQHELQHLRSEHVTVNSEKLTHNIHLNMYIKP